MQEKQKCEKINDLKPFKHGEEGTHSVCNKHNIGGKSVCCKCSGKTDCGDTPSSSQKEVSKCCGAKMQTCVIQEVEGSCPLHPNGYCVECMKHFIPAKSEEESYSLKWCKALCDCGYCKNRVSEMVAQAKADTLKEYKAELKKSIDEMKEYIKSCNKEATPINGQILIHIFNDIINLIFPNKE